jgi:hypothetical protein
MRPGVHPFDIIALPYANAFALKFWDRGGNAHHLEVQAYGTGSSRIEENPTEQNVTTTRIGKFWRQAGTDLSQLNRSNEKWMNAYWLPWAMNRTYEMDLNADADLFFTAGLSGCTFVVSGDPLTPHVAHINRMDGADLTGKMDQLRPQRVSVDPLGIRNFDGGYEDLRPTPTKAETTTRQVLMQEIKASAAARAAGTGIRGTNYGRRNAGGINIGGPQMNGNHIFGVVDWALHYSGPRTDDALASVVGLRDPVTHHWKFYFQKLSGVHHESIRGMVSKRGPLTCVVCKLPTELCQCG